MKRRVKVNGIYIDENLCKCCYLCVEFCPRGVFVRSNKRSKRGCFPPVPARLDRCIGCRLCELYCPDFAIAVDIEEA
ncbi:MAG: 4Fe-4S dicluster domain-containing protein [Candidatus Baldrarchaeia archaeon]